MEDELAASYYDVMMIPVHVSSWPPVWFISVFDSYIF